MKQSSRITSKHFKQHATLKRPSINIKSILFCSSLVIFLICSLRVNLFCCSYNSVSGLSKSGSNNQYIFGNFLTFLSNLSNNQKLTDAHTCYKVFKRNLLKKIKLEENGFNFCPEFTAKISHLGIKIAEVPINYNGRTHKEGKKIYFIDGFRAIIAILKYNLLFKYRKN